MKGYKQKPILIEIFALIYLLNPIGNLLTILYFNTQDTPIANLLKLLTLARNGNIIIILNMLFWLSALPLSYGLYKVRLWAWYYFLIHSIGMVILSLFGSDYKLHFSFATVINFVFLIPIGYFISKEVRTPYFNPRVRWWEQSKRFHHDLQIIIDGKEYTTYDVSESGAFITDIHDSDFEKGELVPMVMVIENESINCFAEIRWLNADSGVYPKGYGIKFDKLPLKSKLKLRNFIKLLQEVGKKEVR